MYKDLNSQDNDNPSRELATYTAFIRVAGMKIPRRIRHYFARAAAGKISHDDLRREFVNELGLEDGD